VDTRDQTLQVYQAKGEDWALVGTFSDEADARIPPFDAIEIPLARMWVK
jgi:hypothetical protein